ncbi:DUF2285 domain-containing protein [Aquibium carbonis]|jgi:hypothetical protein|uniref:DUF2285 domain-containing protein n=1 Tax=Aquibium carbonis TaxID=2495581 RepID=A0A429YYL9_9HYPH|nr:DUF2285 domain-containing protein [Aquibium carbonis]RST86559.1 DUF2285 domain-containing protein [Aquibium carbonis]
MAAPEGFAASSLPDPRTLPVAGELSGDGLHAIAEDDAGDHKIWFRHGDAPTSAGIFLPLDEHFWWRHRNAGRLKRRLDGKLSGPWPRQQRLSAFQIRRAALMLRAWDGVESGASRRAITAVLINRAVETLRAVDWQNAPERRRLARILAAARRQIERDYLRWLTPDGRRSRDLD